MVIKHPISCLDPPIGSDLKRDATSNAFVNIGDLTEVSKVRFYLVNLVMKPSEHVSTMRQDHAVLLYALVKGYEVNVGIIIEKSILDYVMSLKLIYV